MARSTCSPLAGAEPLKLTVTQSLAYYEVIGINVRVLESGELAFDGQLSDPEAGARWLMENEVEIRLALSI